MKAIISYRVEREIEGKDLNEIVSKFENADLNDGKSEFVEIVDVMDAETYEEITNEFELLY